MQFLIFIALILFGIFLMARKKKAPEASTKRRQPKPSTQVQVSYSIPATPAMVNTERQKEAEIVALVRDRLESCGFVLPEKIAYLTGQLHDGFSPFTRVNTKSAFDGDTLLTVPEKRELGLNTRMKYSKNFIECFHSSAFKTIEPKSFLSDVHLDAFHRISRKYELQKLRGLGWIKQVEIMDVGDARDCGKIKRFKKKHAIDAVPELPLPGCTAPYCRCMYTAVVPEKF